MLNTTTGEVEEKRLAHPGEAQKFYRALASANEAVRIGMEAIGHARWFVTGHPYLPSGGHTAHSGVLSAVAIFLESTGASGFRIADNSGLATPRGRD